MRDATISLRLSSARGSLIAQAAALLGTSRTEFVLGAATERAQQVLLDRILLTLSPERSERFKGPLDAPPKGRSAMARLLNRRAPWQSK